MLETVSRIAHPGEIELATRPVVQVQQVSKVYCSGGDTVHALSNISLDIHPGEMVAIMGPSGSGKSTLMTILGLLELPTEGRFQLDGTDASTLNRARQAQIRNQRIGFVFQNFNLLPRLSVLKNVELPLIYGRLSPHEREERARAALTAVGLADKLHNRPNQLSGGQKQRVAIARALVTNPSLILADEPTGALDQRTGREVLELFRTLNREQGLTIIVVTHDLSIARQMDRIIGLCDGRIDPAFLSNYYGETALAGTFSINGHQESQHGSQNGRQSQTLVQRSNHTSQWSMVSGQILKEQIRMAVDSLRANAFRSLLTMLGIIIGAATLVTVLSLGNALQSNVFEQFVDLGTRRITVLPGDPQAMGARDVPGYGLLSTRDYDVVDQLVRQHPDLFEAVVPEVILPMDIRSGATAVETVVVGTNSIYQQVQSTKIEYGRFLTTNDEQQRARVIVLGGMVARDLFGDDAAALQSAIGQTATINGQSLHIIGITRSLGGHNPSDHQVLLPMSTMRLRVVGNLVIPGRGVQMNSITVSVQSDQMLDRAADLLGSTLRTTRGVTTGTIDDFQLNLPTQVLNVLNGINSAITGFIGVIAAISLIVGGIGIMNIMLVAVTERTREIGVRKALGATDGDILGQFLIEALAVSLIGGLIGVGIALGLVVLISVLAGIPAPIAWNAVILALLFASAVGIGFGLYPARRAARLLPVEALRYE